MCKYIHTSPHICFCSLTYQLKRYAVTHFKRYSNKNWHTRAKSSSNPQPRNKYKQQQQQLRK